MPPRATEPTPRGLPTWIFLGIFYAALALAVTWPLARQVGSAVPLGTEKVPTVPLFNIWTLWWNADRLAHFYDGYWDAPIFHPTTGAFAFSEPQPLTGLVAAPLWWLGGPAFAYNGILLLALTLNGALAYRLLRTVGLGLAASLAGGAFVELLPFVLQELGVLQLVSLAGILLTLDALLRFARHPGWGSGSLVGLGLAVTFLSCAYYAVFLSVVLVFCGAWLVGGRLRERRAWLGFAAAALVAGVPVLPVALGQLKASETITLERSAETVNRFAARPSYYLATPWPQWVPLPGVTAAEKPGDRAFFPGTLKILLALLGAAWCLGRRSLRPWGAFCLSAAGLGLLLSLGPQWRLAGLAPYTFLSDFYPGFAQLRSPFRLAVIPQLMVAFLAAAGLDALLAAKGWKRWLPKRGAQGLLLLLTTAAAFEIWPGPQPLQALPPRDGKMAWLDWIEERTTPGDVLAFVPFPRGSSSASYRGTTQWMYWGTRHGRPMVNGYSGFFPPDFHHLKGLMQDFPNAASLDALKAAGVRYVVSLTAAFPAPLDTHPDAVGRLQRRLTDSAEGVEIYELPAHSDITSDALSVQ